MFGRATKLLLSTLVVLVVGGRAVVFAQGNPNPGSGIVPPDARVQGLTYGEWGAAWWSWVMGIPAATNPLTDQTGEFCHEGQAGPVFFLAGNYGGTTIRSCTIPTGKHLFFPVANALWINDPLDVQAAEAFVTSLGLDPADFTVEELLRFTANAQMDAVNVADLTVTIDGVPVHNLGQYRAESPTFALTLVGGSILEPFGYTPGLKDPAVADGYWIMLHPLSVGEHTIRFTATYDDPVYDFTFSLDVTYHLTVAPKGKL